MRAVLSRECMAVRSCALGHAITAAEFYGCKTCKTFRARALRYYVLVCISSRNTVRSCAYQITDQIYVPDGMATPSRSARKLLGNAGR
jgi:hypothetical protein